MPTKTHAVVLATAFAVLALPAQAQHHAAPHWTYEGAGGPAQWGALSPEYKACADGKTQSPIDLGGAVAARRSAINERVSRSAFVLFHNGHTVQAALDRGNTLAVDGVPFEALQFHFHHPSEHTIKGKAYPAEVHLVHRNATGQLAVLGVLVTKTDADNPNFDLLLERLPMAANDSVHFNTLINVGTFLGVSEQDEEYFFYEGSLTTPPCTEGVRWIVRQRPIGASTRQLLRLIKALGENARPTQPVNGRH